MPGDELLEQSEKNRTGLKGVKAINREDGDVR